MPDIIKRGLGAIKSPADPRDHTLARVARTAPFPAKLTLKRLPIIRNQSGVGSCVAHACAYVNEYYDANAYATDFVYGYRPAGYHQGSGMIVREACQTITNLGNILQKDLSTNTEVPDAIRNISQKLSIYTGLAKLNKVTTYARLYAVDEVKTALQAGMPVILALYVYDDFSTDRSGVLINTSARTLIGGHAVTAVGWDVVGGEKCLYVANSWGKGWGKNGFFYLPESALSDPRQLMEMFSVADEYHEELIRRTLRRGMKGEDVKSLQEKLIRLGYKMPKFGADGGFGQETDEAVKAYQKAKRLTADGIVGRGTWAALDGEA